MKKVNFRSVFMALLMAGSFASYVFLSTVDVDNLEEAAIELNGVEATDTDAKIYMPDVELVKKVAAIGKAVMHPFSD